MASSTKRFKRTTVTAALPYANGPVHIGHLAGVYIPADIYVRYLKLKGQDVVFICGSDEHGVPITIKARQEGITPQEVVDKYHNVIKDSFAEFGIEFDVYSRTSNHIHHQTAADFFKKLHTEGKLIEKTTLQLYDSAAQQFLADRYVTGTCPHCSNEKAYGDQCESCGTSLSPTELINPRSTLSGNEPVTKETRHWYLPLDQYEPWLREWILNNHRDDWKVNVYGQCKSWIEQGLVARAVTRDLDWGVKVPLPDLEGKVLYVWFDAPIGYISATREWADERNQKVDQTGNGVKVKWEDYWKDEETRLIHFIGKDNIVFHCIIFPAMLRAEGSYILPDNVPANEFLNLEGDKISTSRNWAVWLHEYLNDFPDRQDELRYALTANAPETKDNDFTWKDFQTRNNSELLAIFGNFVNRTLVLTQKYFASEVPRLTNPDTHDLQILNELSHFPERISRSLDQFRFREALNELMNLARIGNKYLTDKEPWKTALINPDKTGTVLNISLQICANLSVLSQPFLPFTATKLFRMLNIPAGNWNDAGKQTLLTPGHKLGTPGLLFARIEDAQIDYQINKLIATRQRKDQPTITVTPSKPDISYEEFLKMDIRTGTIIAAEPLPKTKKLLKLTIDTGFDKRVVVSGIAEFYAPAEIIGKQVVLLVNLAPREIKGVLSQGMVLMAEDSQGKFLFLATAAKTHDGSEIR